MHTSGGNFAKQAAHELIARQNGAISVRQALAAGLSRRQIEGLAKRHEWLPYLPGVFVHVTSTDTWARRLHAAYVWASPNALVSHLSAAHLHGWVSPPVVPALITLRSLRSQPGKVIVHKQVLDVRETTIRGPFAVTTPERTLVDVASMMHRDRFERMLDEGLRTRTTIARIQAQIELMSGRKVPGMKLLRRLMVDRPIGTVNTESALEDRLISWLKAEGMRLPERQVEIRNGREFVARVDFCYPDEKVIIEVDSYMHHYGKPAWHRDIRRRNLVEALGHKVLHVTDDEIRKRDQTFLAMLRSLLA